MLLRSKDLNTLIEIFSSVGVPIEVWAYGSRVNGTAHSGSDLDLVVRSNDLQKLPAEILKEMKEKIQHSNIPIVVELHDWARLPESFYPNIMAMHEVLYSHSGSMVNEPTAPYKERDKGKGHSE